MRGSAIVLGFLVLISCTPRYSQAQGDSQEPGAEGDNGSSENGSEDVSTSPYAYVRDVVRPRFEALTAAAAACAETLAGRSEDELQDTPCQLKYLTLEESPAQHNSRGRRVLIMDTGMDLPALTRYREQTGGLYRLRADGGLESSYSGDNALSVPAAYADILMMSELHQTFIPINALNLRNRTFSQLENFTNAHLQKQNIDPIAHGAQLFTKILDLVPNAQVWAVQMFPYGLTPSEDFCQMGQAGGMEHIDAVIHRHAEALLQLIRANDIDFISYSQFATLERLEDNWPTLCAGQPRPKRKTLLRWIQLFNDLTKRLVQESEAVMVQAVGVDNGPGQMTSEELCENPHPRHVFVQDARELDAGDLLPIGKDGEISGDLFDPAFQRSRCPYAVYSLDVRHPSWQIRYSMTGFGGYGLFDFTSSSMVPPLAIAHLIHMRDYQGISIPDGIKQLLARPVRAPQRYFQFPSCYLDPNACLYRINPEARP